MELVLDSAISVWGWLLEHLLYINFLFSVVIIFFQRRDPRVVWTRLLTLNFLPVFGIVFYLLFGQDLKESRMFRVKETDDRLNLPIKSQEEMLPVDDMPEELMDSMSRDYKNLILYSLETSGFVLTVDNKVRVYTDGQRKFEALRNELCQACRSVHTQYYIIKSGGLFDSTVPILLEKMKEGAKVRILCDGMGGRFTPGERWEQIKEAGTKIGISFPSFLGWLNPRVNYRSHRKVVVIDDCTEFVGGFNVGWEYISEDPKLGYWWDTHLEIMREAAISLQIRFALDQNYVTGEDLFKEVRYPSDGPQYVTRCLNERMSSIQPGPERVNELVTMQTITSGSDARESHIRNNYLELLYKAKHDIYVQTPYFIPDDAIFSAPRMAALSGMGVRFMIPCEPDYPLMYWATCPYAREPLGYGIRVYIHENRFLHFKGITIDGRVSYYGTANMGIRSFELNFEVNVTIYDEEMTGELGEAFMNGLPHCCEITKRDYMDRSFWIYVKEQCNRLPSPLL